MSENLVNLFTTQFTTNLELALQQKGSKLRGKVDEGYHVGKQASPTQQIKAVKMKAPVGRFAPKERTDTDFVRRWVFPVDREMDQLIDTFDMLRTIVDPKSQYVAGAAAAVGREWDDRLIDAAFARAYTGQDAAALSNEDFDTGSFQISDSFEAAGSVGMTVSKLIEAKRLFRHYHVDIESDPLTLVIGSKQESDLLKQTQVVSTEFNDRPVLVDGILTRFLGFNIIVSERLASPSSLRKVIAFAKSGMYLGVWKDTTNQAFQRGDLSGNPWDLSTLMTAGATRTQPGKVLQILCADSTGADITP